MWVNEFLDSIELVMEVLKILRSAYCWSHLNLREISLRKPVGILSRDVAFGPVQATWSKEGPKSIQIKVLFSQTPALSLLWAAFSDLPTLNLSTSWKTLLKSSKKFRKISKKVLKTWWESFEKVSKKFLSGFCKEASRGTHKFQMIFRKKISKQKSDLEKLNCSMLDRVFRRERKQWKQHRLTKVWMKNVQWSPLTFAHPAKECVSKSYTANLNCTSLARLLYELWLASRKFRMQALRRQVNTDWHALGAAGRRYLPRLVDAM